MSKKRVKADEEVPSLPNPPSLIEYGDMRFLIFDAPSDDNVDVYAKVRFSSVSGCFKFFSALCLVFPLALCTKGWFFLRRCLSSSETHIFGP